MGGALEGIMKTETEILRENPEPTLAPKAASAIVKTQFSAAVWDAVLKDNEFLRGLTKANVKDLCPVS